MEKASRQNYHFIQAEKYRLGLVIISFLAFHFCTIIAEYCKALFLRKPAYFVPFPRYWFSR